jgi:exopolyphosphatase/guanosine-5'-triphosphate,3'-diphosphate pyrophosphatase
MAQTAILQTPPDTDIERHLLAWADRHLGGNEHELQVMRLATRLFHLTAHRHALSDRFRTLLRWSAIVHDVGRSIDDADHPAEGAFMLLADTTLPLTARDRRWLAFLTRYHRGRVPERGEESILHPHDPRDALRTTLALLRAADALDKRRRKRSPKLRLSLTGSTLRIDCHAPRRVVRAIDNVGKFQLLTQTTGCEIQIRHAA